MHVNTDLTVHVRINYLNFYTFMSADEWDVDGSLSSTVCEMDCKEEEKNNIGRRY